METLIAVTRSRKTPVQILKDSNGKEFIYAYAKCQDAKCKDCYPYGVQIVNGGSDDSSL